MVDSGEDNAALDHVLDVRRHAHQVEAVIQHAKHHGAYQRADNGTSTTGDSCPTKHYGGDGIQLKTFTGVGLPAYQA